MSGNPTILSSRVRLARNFEDIPFDVSNRPEFAAVCISRTMNALKAAGEDPVLLGETERGEGVRLW